MCRREPSKRALLNSIVRSVKNLNRKVDRLMTQQEDLNALVARIDAAVAGIRQDIADIKAANPAVDFSALEEKVAALESLDAENPEAPVEPPAEEQ